MLSLEAHTQIQPRISVALCTFNGAPHLAAQLASIAAQTLLPAELVITDDGSTDATEALIHDFAARAPFPVHFSRNPTNLGSTQNFARAISLCTGDVIALADQDDLWHPEKLATLAPPFLQDPTLTAIFSNAALIDAQSHPIPGDTWSRFLFTAALQQRLASGDATGVLLQTPIVTGAAMLFRASLRDRALPIPPGWVHDSWLAWIAALTGRLAAVDRPLLQYRLHATQQLGLATRGKRERLRTEGLRKLLAEERQSELRRHTAFAEQYASLLAFARQNILGTPEALARIERKRAFAAFQVENLSRSRPIRLLRALTRLPDYRAFTPHGPATVLRNALL